MEMLLKRHSQRKQKRGLESVTLIPTKLKIKGDCLKLIPKKTEVLISWVTFSFGWIIPIAILSSSDFTVFYNGKLSSNMVGVLLFFSVLQIMSIVFMNALAHPTFIFNSESGKFLEQGPNHIYTKKLRSGINNEISLSEIKAIQLSSFDAKTSYHARQNPHDIDSEQILKVKNIINNRICLLLDHKMTMPIFDSIHADEVMEKAQKIADFIGVEVI